MMICDAVDSFLFGESACTGTLSSLGLGPASSSICCDACGYFACDDQWFDQDLVHPHLYDRARYPQSFLQPSEQKDQHHGRKFISKRVPVFTTLLARRGPNTASICDATQSLSILFLRLSSRFVALLNVFPLIRRMRMPFLLKQLRNPVKGMVPVVKDLASLVRPSSNVVGSGLGHCQGGSALFSLLLGTPALTMSIVCLVAPPDVQLPLHGTICTRLHQEIKLWR